MNDLPLFAYVPYVKSSDTSRDAAESMRPHVSEIEQRVLAFVKLRARTCEELEEATGLSHQTASARLKGLADKGLIKDSGARRPTRSGRAARVYVAT
jgi:DNA-binding Lrp family transcriptional regulator